MPADQVDATWGPMDLVVEAIGVVKLEFNLLDASVIDVIYMLTSIPGGDRPVDIPGANFIGQLV